MNRILLISTILLLFSCSESPDKIDLKVNRFEQDLFDITAANAKEKLASWPDKFGSFNVVFSTQIMQRGNLTDEQYINELLAFTSHKDMREAYDSTSLLFQDFSKTEEDLEFAFAYFNEEFPSYPIPVITTFFSGFNYGVVTYDDNIAIGLENFLGSNSKYYALLGDPEYLQFQKQAKFIVPNVIEVWVNEYFQKYIGGRDLLSQLIYKGKVMYCIDKMLPNYKLEDKFRFTETQMEWVEENESEIWEYLINQDLLFSKKESEFRSFVNYAPFAKGMPKDAPGRVAYYVGYKMVSEYMENNELDIEELMYLTNSRDFLKQSKYKPTKYL